MSFQDNSICKSLTFPHKTVPQSAISISCDDVYALPTEVGLHVTRLLYSPVQKDQQLCFSTTIIPPGESLQFDVGVDRSQLHNKFDYEHLDEMYKVMVDRTQSPAVKSTVSHRDCKTMRWSPDGADLYARPVLAVLTFDHRLSVYQVQATKKKYDLIFDLSEDFNRCLQEENFGIVTNRINMSPTSQSIFAKLEHRTYALAAVDMVWSDLWSSDQENFSLMFVVMKSGHLVIWKVNFPVTAQSFELLEMVDMGNAIPSKINVVRVDSNKCLLFVGYNNGQIKSFMLYNHMGEFEVQQNIQLWTDKDDILISHIAWVQENHILLCGKGVFLLAFLLDMNPADGKLKIVQQSHIIVSDKLQITEICHKNKRIFISIQDGTVYECELKLQPGVQCSYISKLSARKKSCSHGRENYLEVKIELTTFPISRPTSHIWGSNGLSLTQNEVYLFEVSSPLNAYDHLVLVDPLRVNCIQLKSPCMVAQELAQAAETGEKLYKLKDLLVYMKCHMLKEGSYPALLAEWLDNSDTWSVRPAAWLKILRYLLQVKFTHAMQTVVQETKDKIEEDIEVVDKLILLRHTSERLQLLLDVEKEQGLSGSDITCICLMCKFIQNCPLSNETQQALAVSVCKAFNLSVDGNLPGTLERCKMCNADISTKHVYREGCPNGHNIGRCSQTLMICQELPYRVCENCRMLAVSSNIKGSDWFEALKSIYCTFCDGTVK